ncbi:MAG: transposase, partial [Desulfobulbus sp.]|nr:transposase [Desulfobulbus sp.]
RVARHAGYAVSLRIRKRVEQIFGWMKTIAGLRKVKYAGEEKFDCLFAFAAAVYNLVRMRNLGLAAS